MGQRVLHYNAIFAQGDRLCAPSSRCSIALSVGRVRSERAAGADRSAAGLPIGRRSDGSRRHGRRRERDAGARSARAGIHRHRRRAAAPRHQRGVHLRQQHTVQRAREAARSVRVEQHRSPPGPPHHAGDRSQQHRHAHAFAARRRRSSSSSRASRPTTAWRSSPIPPPGPIGRFHDQPRASPRRHLAHRRVDEPMLVAVQHQRLRGHHVRESIEPHCDAAAAVSRVRRYRSQHDVAVRSRRRAGSA